MLRGVCRVGYENQHPREYHFINIFYKRADTKNKKSEEERSRFFSGIIEKNKEYAKPLFAKIGIKATKSDTKSL